MEYLFRMAKRKKEIERELEECRTKLGWLVKGRIECHRVKPNGRQKTETFRWFVVKNKKRKYIKKCDREYAEELAYRRVLKARINKLENELLATDVYLGMASGSGSRYITKKANGKISRNKIENRENEEVRRLAYSFQMKTEAERYEWANAEYRDWNYYPDELTVTSKRGILVRSRIEANICDSLDNHGLYYRYEDILEFDGIITHPDFVIIDPKTDKKIIWEHLGGLENEKYRNTNIKKLRRYFNNGYYPNINLILTSEKEGEQLDLTIIEAIIEQFFE